jgi:hypothetical protein
LTYFHVPCQKLMRIKIIGDNNCARATRHLLRKAGFAVTEFLPADVVTQAPHSGYAITVDLAPAPHTPDPTHKPGYSTHGQTATEIEEASALAKAMDDASSPTSRDGDASLCVGARHAVPLQPAHPHQQTRVDKYSRTHQLACIHFDSVDSELEAAILRHVTQLAAAPVIVDRPGGVVHSERELRIVVPNSGDPKTDEAAAVAVEFGVLRGLLDLASPPSLPKSRGANAGKASLFSRAKEDKSAAAPGSVRSEGGKAWWRFFLLALAAVLPFVGSLSASPRRALVSAKPVPVELALTAEARVADRAAMLPAAALPPQGQFSTGQAPVKITDGTNTLVVDPCKGQTKLYVSINQTANTQLVAGTASKKIYICSIHVVVAVATSVALVEGTGSVCATGTAGVSGLGGATAATGWNFAVNGGIVLGNGDAAVGAEGTSADNLCLFNSGSGQVSGGISYVVQ